jgi:hypothetical protein
MAVPRFRVLLLGVLAVGLVVGVAFGTGIAVGKGDRQTVQTGLTQQQLQSLLGVGGAAAAGASQGARGALNLGGNTIGQVTAIEGQTVTVQTQQATVKVAVGPSTTVNTYGGNGLAGLKTGDAVVVAGQRKDDGSIEATSISQLPPELQSLASGGRPGGAPTPTR